MKRLIAVLRRPFPDGNLSPMNRKLLLLLAVALAAGCGGSSVPSEVDRGVTYAKKVLDEANRNLPSTLSLNAILDMGGDPVTYVTATIGDPAGFPPFIWQGPAAPNSVVIRPGAQPLEFVIEGYGADTAKPVRTETFRFEKYGAQPGR